MHMVAAQEQLNFPKQLSKPMPVTLGNGRRLTATQEGSARVIPNVILTNALCVPGLRENLLSVAALSTVPRIDIRFKEGR